MSDVSIGFVEKILKDYEEDRICLCSSIQDIKKVSDICQTLNTSKKRKPTGPQDYCIKFFIAENLSAYYPIDSKEDISKAYVDIQTK